MRDTVRRLTLQSLQEEWPPEHVHASDIILQTEPGRHDRLAPPTKTGKDQVRVAGRGELVAVQPRDEISGDARLSGAAQLDSGFTLIEMIVVLVVLALAGSIVLARGPMHSATLDLRATARTMASDMRRIRAGAIATDHDVVFTVDPARRDYGINKGARHGLAAAISIIGTPAPIVFHADGSSSGGVVTLGETERRLAVQVDWLTGRVEVR